MRQFSHSLFRNLLIKAGKSRAPLWFLLTLKSNCAVSLKSNGKPNSKKSHTTLSSYELNLHRHNAKLNFLLDGTGIRQPL